MTDFSYTVKNGDRGLTYIFLNKAKEAGYEGDTSKVNWNNVLSVFDEIQAEEKAEGEQLYSGGNDKTRAGWGKSYIIKVGDVINLTKAQLHKIYTAMGFTKTAPAGGVSDPAGGVKPGDTNPEDISSDVVDAEQAKKDFESVKVTVPMKKVTAVKPESQEEVVAIKKNRQDGYEVAEKIIAAKSKIDGLASMSSVNEMKEALKLITKDNVLYVLEKIPNLVQIIDDVDALGFGLDKDDVIKYVLTPLGQKGDEYGWHFDDISLSQGYEQWASDWSLEYIEQEIEKVAYDCRKKELSKLNYASELEQVRDLTKAQQVFDDANKFLADVANMNPKPEIKSRHDPENNCDVKCLVLPDGRAMMVSYDENGEINSISISYDTTSDIAEDGTTIDGTEVKYSRDKAYYNTDKNNTEYEGYITSGYDFEKLKALAEKIFGNNK